MKKKGFLSRWFNRNEEASDLPDSDSPFFSMPQVMMSRAGQMKIEIKQDGIVDEVFLRQQMLNFLSVEQVEEIAKHCDIDPAQLEGGKGRKVMGLLTAVLQKNTLPRLLKQCQETVPHVTWQKSKP